jgi:hypothetical protein
MERRSSERGYLILICMYKCFSMGQLGDLGEDELSRRSSFGKDHTILIGTGGPLQLE